MSTTREQTIASFFAAMNTGDADAAAALVDPDVEITIGSQAFVGRDAVRQLAVQRDAELAFETIPVTIDADADGVAVVARRVQRWRQSGEIASDEEVRARFSVASDGLIKSVRLS